MDELTRGSSLLDLIGGIWILSLYILIELSSLICLCIYWKNVSSSPTLCRRCLRSHDSSCRKHERITLDLKYSFVYKLPKQGRLKKLSCFAQWKFIYSHHSIWCTVFCAMISGSRLLSSGGFAIICALESYTSRWWMEKRHTRRARPAQGIHHSILLTTTQNMTLQNFKGGWNI